jgi:MFS superfamily sulfate permease-like transporter
MYTAPTVQSGLYFYIKNFLLRGWLVSAAYPVYFVFGACAVLAFFNFSITKVVGYVEFKQTGVALLHYHKVVSKFVTADVITQGIKYIVQANLNIDPLISK